MEDWAALVGTADRRSRAREIAVARDRVFSAAADGGVAAGMGASSVAAGGTDPDLRPVIMRSWRRSAAAGVDPDRGLAPVRLGTDEVDARWAGHPLSIAVPILQGLLEDAGDLEHVALICDADGALLWIDGRPAVLEQAREVHLERGSIWSEVAAGTNAMGTALEERHPVQVFSAEHFTETVHRWTCSAAPVRDPLTGKVLGVLDLTGELGTAHPHSLAVVTMAARLVERELSMRAAVAGAAPVADGLAVLGRERGVLRARGRETRLSPRHTEILLLLWLCGEGLTAEQLALELWGEKGRPGSVRSELHRLRPVLGALLAERPYRLAGPLTVDVGRVEERIRDGRVAEVLEDYEGPLLPHSAVPRIAELRDRIDDGLRAAVLASGEAALLERWLRTPSGRDDLEASRQLALSLPRDDPRRAAQRSRIRRLANDR